VIMLLTERGLPAGTVIDGWKVLGPLGSGGYGAVQKVVKNGRLYALKIALLPEGAHDDKQTHQRAMRELLCLLLLDHPHIIKARAMGQWPTETGGHVYVVLDYVEGWTLAKWLERKHPTFREIVRVFAKLAAALAYMHGEGVFHRDLKLLNVLIRQKDGEPVIIDFGAADFTQARGLTEGGLPPGTQRYRAPEALRWQYLHRKESKAQYDFRVTDELFALGVMLYDALTDPRPTQERTRTDLNTLLVNPLPPEERNPRIPAALVGLVRRLLAREPSERPEDMEAVRRELVELEAHQDPEYDEPAQAPSTRVEEPAEAAPLAEAPPEASRRPLRRALWGASAVAVAVLAAVALLQVSPKQPSAPAMAPPVAEPAPSSERVLLSPPPSPSAPVENPPPIPSLPTATRSSPTVSVPPRQESPRWKAPPRSVSPSCAEQQVPSFTSQAHFRQWCQSAGVLGTVLAFCAGCPAVQLYPKAERCPDDAIHAMKVNKLKDGDMINYTLAGRADSLEMVTLRSGAVTAAITSEPHMVTLMRPRVLEALPPGTLLYGQLWANTGDENDAIVRFDRVRTPDNREFPVCIVGGERGALPLVSRPTPGAVITDGAPYGTVRFRWLDPCEEVDCKEP